MTQYQHTTQHSPETHPPTPLVATWVIVVSWILLILSWIVYLRTSDQRPLEATQSFIDTARGNWWAIPAFIGIYLVRPLILVPASLLTVAGGLLFGATVGIGVTIVAANGSALVAFWVGHRLSPAWIRDSTGSLVATWRDRLIDQSFVTVLVMRFAFLPYDMVNYVCGFLRIRTRAFLVATAIGSLPGTVAFVLAGASITRLDDGLNGVNPVALVASIALFVASLTVAKQLQKKESLS